MSADLGLTSILLSSSFLRSLISELAEQNPTISGHMVGSKCDLKMHVQNLGYPLPLQIGDVKDRLLRRFRNLTATLTAYIFGSSKRIDNYTGSPISCQNIMNFGPQTASN